MIKLNDVFWLDSDDQQFIVGRKAIRSSGKHKGEEYIAGEAYFSSLSGVVNFLLKDEIRKSVKTCKNVQELLERAGQTVTDFEARFADELKLGKLTPQNLGRMKT